MEQASAASKRARGAEGGGGGGAAKRAKGAAGDEPEEEEEEVKLCCCVCLCVLLEPVTLPCGHTLDKACLEQDRAEVSLLLLPIFLAGCTGRCSPSQAHLCRASMVPQGASPC